MVRIGAPSTRNPPAGAAGEALGAKRTIALEGSAPEPHSMAKGSTRSGPAPSSSIRKATPIKGSGILLLAAAIGALGGFLGSGFQQGVLALTSLLVEFLTGSGETTDSVVDAALALEWWQRILLPAVGGVVAALLLVPFGRDSSPFGIADIVGLVALRRGTIRVRNSLMQIASSAATIATGGSIGKEGANSQLATTVATILGRVARVGSRNRAVLLGCGVAAGVACSYNAPIAAAIFVMEAVLGNFAMDVFAPVVVSAVISTVIRREVMDDIVLYATDVQYRFGPYQVFASVMLGALCGIGGLMFRWALRNGRRAFRLIPGPLALRMGLGGLIVGAIGVFVPQVWGNGFEVIDTLTEPGGFGSGELTHVLQVTFSLVLWKVVATAVTAGSGALGGIFTPNMVVGAAAGSLFGLVVAGVMPAASAPETRAVFALVGMAGLIAATTHAPITAVVLILEMTRDYELVLPLMLCSITASVVSRALDPDSHYTERLKASGGELPTGLEELAIKTNYVRDVMRTDAETVSHDAQFEEVLERFTSSRRNILYATRGDGRLEGEILLHDVKIYINDPTLRSVVIASDLASPVEMVDPDQSLAEILERFDDQERPELPVRSRSPGAILAGRITRRDVIACLSDEVLRQRSLRARFTSPSDAEATLVELPEGYQLDRVPIPPESIGLAVDGADLPSHGLLPLVIVRDAEGKEQRLPALPQLILEEGDELVVLGLPEARDHFIQGSLTPNGVHPEAP